MESKTFEFSVMDGSLVLRLEERRRGLSCVLSLSTMCIDWLSLTVEELMQCDAANDFFRSFHEGPKVVTGVRDGNRFGRYLKVVVLTVGGWKRFVIIPEGQEGWGWNRFSFELKKVKALFDSGLGLSTVKRRFGVFALVENNVGPRLGLIPD